RWRDFCTDIPTCRCRPRERRNKCRAKRATVCIRGVRHGDSYGDHAGICVVLESLVSTRARRDRHDGDLQSTICMDAIYRSDQPEARNDTRRTAMDVLSAHYSSDVVLSTPGLSG